MFESAFATLDLQDFWGVCLTQTLWCGVCTVLELGVSFYVQSLAVPRTKRCRSANLTKANMHSRNRPSGFEASDEAAEDGFQAMTAEEAQQWRLRNPQVSAQRVLGLQVIVAVVVALVLFGWFGQAAGMSAAYGSFAVIVPALVLARGLRRRSEARDPAVVLLSFVVWEAVKVMLTVALLLLAPQLVSALNWLALVLGFVVTMKVYLVAAWLLSRRQHPTVIN